MQQAIPASIYRGGTSRGLYFLADDLPADAAARDRILLAAMGSPDPRQVDGLGGAHPLTSKVAIVSSSARDDAHIDYLFLQVAVDTADVSDSQNCGNILAGVGPFAIESGLVAITGEVTDVRIHLVNSGSMAVVRVETPSGRVNYEGSARIDGVPGTAAPVLIDFLDIAGSSCGEMLPTGRVCDVIADLEVTCIDNGMPTVIMNASDLGLTGQESPQELESNHRLRQRVETVRLLAGQIMRLGDVSRRTVPKMCLVSPPTAGGWINTRTFIPHRVHEAIGVLGSVSVATACLIEGTVAQQVCGYRPNDGLHHVVVEHASGSFSVEMDVAGTASPTAVRVERAALLRTARLLMRGVVMVPSGEPG